MKRIFVLAVAWALAPLPGPGLLAAEEKAADEEKAAVKEDAAKSDAKVELTQPLVFQMEEVSVFDKQEVSGRTRMLPASGQLVRCTTEPSKAVKTYPKLHSQRPLYGWVRIDGSPYDPGMGTTYYFVLDESGKPEKEEGKDKDVARRTEQSLLSLLGSALSGNAPEDSPSPSAQERQRAAVKSTYDLLYFDRNGDLDLTNDGVLEPLKQPISALLRRPGAQAFEDIELSIDYGPAVGKRPFAVVLQHHPSSPDRSYVELIAKVARRGKVRIGDEEYLAYLTQSQIISGRFDRPFVYLALSPTGSTQPDRMLLKSGNLGQIRSISGNLVTVSATPLGDELTIAPYRGDVGVLEIGSGGRAITELGFTGGLVSRTMLVTLGETGSPLMTPELRRRYLVPVGDYLPARLTARHGRLRFGVRALRESDLPAGEKKAASYGIKVRQDRPCVVEFSGKPEVLVLDPRDGRSFKPGEQVEIRVMLAEPQQGILITGLEDITKPTGELKYRIEGQEVVVPRYTQLDPTIVIRSSEGKQVATGTMPFG